MTDGGRIRLCNAALLVVAVVLTACEPSTDAMGAIPPKDDAGGAGTTEGGLSDGGYVRPIPIPIPSLPIEDINAFLKLLPKDANGNPILFGEGTETNLVVDTNSELSPINALAQCSKLLSWCVKTIFKADSQANRQGRALVLGQARDVCWISVPKCTTDAPWKEIIPCCPATCVDAYEAARAEGEQPFAAQKRVLFKKPRCIPGLDTDLGEAP